MFLDYLNIRKPFSIFFACQHHGIVIRDVNSMYYTIKKPRTRFRKIWSLQRRFHLT